ncbi:Two-component sensor PilS [Enhygromyxa salina]|uniref:histidine kinase n=1 Tax=Enhygromyxa salina TaxID=215803 RepID=A0A0C1ZPB0_9BACT|nr:HAMP domain-containing sensor histidine kinase [Enhygromyxa salina]KIG12853.1 Two-component sensor PilS [Enhygromyxa salina]
MALGEIDDRSDEELIGGPEQPSDPPAQPELPPLRIRGSLAARIVALVVLVVFGTGAAALIIRAQVRGLGANFDLLTGVYIPFQTKLLGAQNQSQRIGSFVSSYGNPEAQLGRGDLLNLEEALELRAHLVTEVRAPLEQALLYPDRLGGLEQLDDVRALVQLVDGLAELVALDEEFDVTVVLADAPRQADINRRFAELEIRANQAVRSQRDTVAAARRAAEQRALVITIAAAAFSLLATLIVILTLRPLRRLAVSVRRIGRGEWRERIEVGPKPERDDEVARLAREVNLMAATLEERERRLLRGEQLAAIGRLAAQITHEIRNPLSSVALNAELLEDELDSLGTVAGVDEARTLLGRISGEVDRLTQITEAYLGLARRPAPQMAKIDLRRELTDLLDFTAHEHERNRVKVVRELPELPVWVEADAGQLRQALLNLLRNAQEAVLELAGDPLEAGPEGAGDLGDLLDDFDGGADDPGHGRGSALAATAVGTITVSLVCKHGMALVVVADDGPGIPAANDNSQHGGIERIFEAFVTSKAHGTGLGLPMVRQIAADHGGAVVLLQTGPDGTRFEFRLPACDPPAPSVSSETDSAASADGR